MEDNPGYSILVNPIQQRNPVTKLLRAVPWQVSEIVPDFVMGRTSCCLFISVQYHSLHPEYIHGRIDKLGKLYELRILLVLVDTPESQKVLSELAKIALTANLTLLLSWTNEEAARYIESYKIFENKSADAIMERSDLPSSQSGLDCLTSIKKINKTDASTLIDCYGSLDKIITADKQGLTLVPGMGSTKAEKLYNVFHEPFVISKPQVK